jgi:hypothetical protein
VVAVSYPGGPKMSKGGLVPIPELTELQGPPLIPARSESQELLKTSRAIWSPIMMAVA